MATLAVGLLASPAMAASSPGAEPGTDYAKRITITRDTWGIAHVKGHTDADAVFGMVYAQAEDDFPRIEANFLTSLGRMAEAEGEKAIWQDLRQRLFVDPVTLQADYAASPLWLKKLMQAWAAGLNHYLATYPQVKPRVLTHFEPWMALSFPEGSIGGDIEAVPLSQLEAFYGKQPLAMTAMELGLVFREPAGSNGIAIAPSHTKDGHALLLINPHTTFFFRSELQMTSDEGLNAYGAATWGQFFIYQGFNANAGWMHTTSGVDRVDEFAETVEKGPDGTLRYRHGTAWRPVTTKTITLNYRTPDGGQATRSFATYATHNGPITRAQDGRWIATSLMNRPVQAIEQSFLRTKARDLAGFMKVAALQGNSSNNTLFADSKGAIAYLHPQFVAKRDDRFDYRQPVDGSDPRTAWQGMHAMATLPQVISPANGWVMNVNNWPWTAAGKDSPKRELFPRYMDQVGDNPRGDHAIRVLSDRRDFTLDGLVAAAYDPYLPAFARLLPPLTGAWDRLAEGDARRAKLAPAIAMLKAWDYRWAIDSRATSVAVFWGEAMWPVVSDAARAAKLSAWDYIATRSTDAQKLDALDKAIDRLTADFGGIDVPWGQINRLQRNDGAIAQTFDDSKPSLPVPFTSAQWGSLASFAPKRFPGAKHYYGTSGNSFVAAVEFGPRLKARAVSVGGESGDPASPHFADQSPLYAAGKLRDVYFYPEDVAQHRERTYHPGE
ncbi:penicillin acylase family protein [Sphingobium aquiterrae]|uniref:penicillin acylase family protein n=1 Tax=Sphingobium aquiterrae TaxID=2038656 RepID=UPI003AFB20BB